jgi:hypothetical protein
MASARDTKLDWTRTNAVELGAPRQRNSAGRTSSRTRRPANAPTTAGAQAPANGQVRRRATARWPEPCGGTSDAAAGRTMAQASDPPGAPGRGTNRAPARPPRAGKFTVARTRVLIKTASHPDCTCVLITCMSQATYGPWPRSDVIPRCRQNGSGALSGTVGHPVTCHDDRGAGTARHPCGGAVWRDAVREHSPGGRLDRVAATARIDGAGGRPGSRRSLPVAQSRQRPAAGGGARPRPAMARAPC